MGKSIDNISADSTNVFSFYVIFCEQHHPQSVPLALYRVLIEGDFEK